MDKPILSKQAFWDVDMDNIDYKNAMLNVLERILLRGSEDDFREIRRFYGDKKIREKIIYIKCFGPKEVNFCCLIFNLKTTDFVHYEAGRFKAYPEFKDCPADFEYPDYALEALRDAS
jgi:hypothetical protein